MKTISNQVKPVANEGDTERPFITTNPLWSDTWGVAAVDPDSNQAYWAQVLCNASTGKTRHFIMAISNGRSWREDAYTDTAFVSDLMDVEISGWGKHGLKSASRNIDLEAISNHEPIDFAKLLSFKNLQLGHQETSVRVTGHIDGQPFRGVGLRDRSFGPRPMDGIGVVNSVVMTAMDQSASMAANIVWGSDRPLADAASMRFGFVNSPAGSYIAKPEEIRIRRHCDGIVESLRIGDDVVSLTREIGHHHYTPHWYPSLDLSPAETPILSHILRFFEGSHPKFGRMAGFVDQGFLTGT